MSSRTPAPDERVVHAVVPAGMDDPDRPSGGNAYDRRVLGGLADRGWEVVRHDAEGAWPDPSDDDRAAVGRVLSGLRGGSVVLVDGLVGSALGPELAAAATRLSVVLLVHLPLGVVGGSAVGASEAAAVASATRVVVTSRWTADWLVANAGARPDRVRVAVPGVDPGAPTVPQPGGGRLVTVGAVTPVKGTDRVVEALAAVADLSWTWTCVGPADRDAAFARSVRSAARRAGLADRVRWAGALPPEAVADVLGSADLLVVGSRVETYGMVVTEALARGVPAVVTPVGGLAEAIGATVDGRRPGIVAERDGPDALAAAVRAWLSDAHLRERLRRAAADRRREGLPTWEATTGAVEVALQECRRDR